jgi:hypothetical protein
VSFLEKNDAEDLVEVQHPAKGERDELVASGSLSETSSDLFIPHNLVSDFELDSDGEDGIVTHMYLE